MTRALIPLLDNPGIASEDLAWTPGDASDSAEFVNDGKIVLLMHNGGTVGHTVTIVSVADKHGRTGDLTQELDADAFGAAGPLYMGGFNQTDEKVNVDNDGVKTEVEFVCIAVP